MNPVVWSHRLQSVWIGDRQLTADEVLDQVYLDGAWISDPVLWSVTPDKLRVSHVVGIRRGVRVHRVLVRCGWCLRLHLHRIAAVPGSGLAGLDELDPAVRTVVPACSALSRDQSFGLGSEITGFSHPSDPYRLPGETGELARVLTAPVSGTESLVRPGGFDCHTAPDGTVRVHDGQGCVSTEIRLTTGGVRLRKVGRDDLCTNEWIELNKPEGVGELLQRVDRHQGLFENVCPG